MLKCKYYVVKIVNRKSNEVVFEKVIISKELVNVIKLKNDYIEFLDDFNEKIVIEFYENYYEYKEFLNNNNKCKNSIEFI